MDGLPAQNTDERRLDKLRQNEGTPTSCLPDTSRCARDRGNSTTAPIERQAGEGEAEAVGVKGDVLVAGGNIPARRSATAMETHSLYRETKRRGNQEGNGRMHKRALIRTVE